MEGKVKNISVAGMLRFLCSYGKTGRLNVNDNETNGFIDIYEGQITGAGYNGNESAADCYENLIKLLMVVGKGVFFFEERQPASLKPLGISVEKAVIESARELFKKSGQVEGGIDEYLFPENEVLKFALMHQGKKIDIVLEADEWNLLTAFGGEFNIRTAMEHVKIDKEKAKFILYGLVSAGLLRRTRFKIPEISKIAREAIGNIGAAIVDNEMRKMNIDKNRMGMRELISVLNGLEFAFSEIVGRARAKEIIEKIWSGTK